MINRLKPCYNNILTNLSLPKLTSCGDNFLYSNEELKNLSLPNLTEYGDNFLYNNKTLKKKFLSKVKFKSLKAKLLTKLFKKEKKLEDKVK